MRIRLPPPPTSSNANKRSGNCASRSILIVSNWKRDECFVRFFLLFLSFFLFLLNLLIAAATGNTKSIYDPIRKFHNLTRKVWNRTFYSIKEVEESLFHGWIFTRLLSSEQQRGGERTRAPTIGWSLVTTDPYVNFSTFPQCAVRITPLYLSFFVAWRIILWRESLFESYILYQRRERKIDDRVASLPCPSKLRKDGYRHEKREREKERNLVIYIVIRRSGVSFRTLSTGLKINTPPSPSVRRCFHYPVILFTCFQFPGQLIRRSLVKRDLPHRGLVWLRRVSMLRGSSCNCEMIHAHAFPPIWN